MRKSKKNAVKGETPCPERFRHMGGLRCDLVKDLRRKKPATLRYRTRWASPLELYRDRQVINEAQYEAGLQFWQAYHHAVSGGAACCERASRIDSPTRLRIPDTAARALVYVKQAYAVLTSDMLDVLVDICAYGQPAASPQEFDLLRKGLGRLAQEWGFAASELCEPKRNQFS
ncbi:MAG: hypothetical protein FWF24_01565 [Alphaproteobacteria bacterium]|nr:hypothetical protein [Alphaproteobacteria bacterium]